MKKILAKIWKTKLSVFYLLLYVALLFSAIVEQRFSSNYLAVLFNSVGLPFTGGTYWMTFFLSSAMSLVFVVILLKIYWIFFGYIYARSFSGRIASINELPIGKLDFQKFILLFSIITNLVVGIMRLFILVDYKAYFLINFVFRPLVSFIIAALAFFVMKKYMLEGKVAYNTFMALSIPYILYMAFSYLL